MKVFVFFLFVAMFSVVEITSTGSEEFVEDVKKSFEECGKELDIPEEKMKEYETMTELSDEKMENCLIACVLEKAGFMEDGKLRTDKMDLLLDQRKEKEEVKAFQAAIKKCEVEASKKEEKCAIAGSLAKCVSDEFKSAQ